MLTRVTKGLISGRLLVRRGGFSAPRASIRKHFADRVRVLSQLARNARAAFALLFRFLRLVCFLALRRRQRRIAGRLGRDIKPRFEFCHASRKSRVLLCEKPDLLHLLQNQRDEFLLAERIERLWSHPKLESARDSCVNRAATVIQNALGVSSYQ